MSSRSLRILEMKPEHIGPCARIVGETPLFRRYGWTVDAATEALSRARFAPDTDLRVALCEGRPGGFAWFLPHGAFARSGYLRLLAVDETLRRRGLARELMKVMEERYLEPNGILLLVTETNETARRFYEALGYRMIGELPGYIRPDLDECIYHKAPRSR